MCINRSGSCLSVDCEHPVIKIIQVQLKMVSPCLQSSLAYQQCNKSLKTLCLNYLEGSIDQKDQSVQYSGTVLKYNLEVFVRKHLHFMPLYTTTPLQFRGKHYTCYSATFI